MRLGTSAITHKSTLDAIVSTRELTWRRNDIPTSLDSASWEEGQKCIVASAEGAND